MKKNVVRIVAALLVAMLALTLIPMGALALTVDVVSEGYEDYPTYDEWATMEGILFSHRKMDRNKLANNQIFIKYSVL